MAAPVVEVDVLIPAPPDTVWEEVGRIERHPGWMSDAAALRFIGDRREGVGTRVEVVTRIGPLRTVDHMEFTAWEPPRRMAVAHTGLFTGTGEFTLDAEDGGTRFRWREQIVFPWYFGGPLGARLAAPVLRRVWRRNLGRLRERFT